MVLPASQIMTTTRSTASARKGSALNCAEPVHIEEALFSFVVCFVVVTSRSTWNLEVGPVYRKNHFILWVISLGYILFYDLKRIFLITEFFYVIWLQQNRIIFKWSWSSICAMVLDYFSAFPWIKFTFCIVSFSSRELWCVWRILFTENYGVFLFFLFFLNWFLLCFVFCVIVICAAL